MDAEAMINTYIMLRSKMSRLHSELGKLEAAEEQLANRIADELGPIWNKGRAMGNEVVVCGDKALIFNRPDKYVEPFRVVSVRQYPIGRNRALTHNPEAHQ